MAQGYRPEKLEMTAYRFPEKAIFGIPLNIALSQKAVPQPLKNSPLCH